MFYLPSGKIKSSRSLNAILSDTAERATEPSYQLRLQWPWAIWSPCNLTFGKTSAKRPSAAGLAIKDAASAGISSFFSIRISTRRCCRSWVDNETPSAFLKLRDAKRRCPDQRTPQEMLDHGREVSTFDSIQRRLVLGKNGWEARFKERKERRHMPKSLE